MCIERCSFTLTDGGSKRIDVCWLDLGFGWSILFRNVARGLQKLGICSLFKTTAEGGCGHSSVRTEAGSA